MEWDHEMCLRLYQLKPEIWEPTHNLYHNKIKKQDQFLNRQKTRWDFSFLKNGKPKNGVFFFFSGFSVSLSDHTL